MDLLRAWLVHRDGDLVTKEPGWDPILDGTAAPYIEMKLNIRDHEDGSRTIEVEYPDGEIALYGTWPDAARVMSEWVKEHPDAYRTD